MRNHDLDSLRAVLQYMEARRAQERESVRASIRAARLPMPQPIVKQLERLNPRDAIDVLKDHPGFKAWQRWKSYQAALAVFERSMHDLFDAIDTLATRMRSENLFSKVNHHVLEEGELRIHKELFAAGNAAHSLKDHASHRLQEVVLVSGFQSKLAEHFGDDGLHDFVIGLRTITHHIQVVKPQYNLTRRFGDEADEVAFQLDRDELLTIVETVKADGGKYKINEAGRGYLRGSSKGIDVGVTYRKYFLRARAFHEWFKGEIQGQPPEELRDFERCLKANKDNATRMWWKMLLINLLQSRRNSPNPYQHLDKFLAPEQIEEIERLPRKSKQQVEKVIEFVDEERACDDELRDLAYELFRRAPD